MNPGEMLSQSAKSPLSSAQSLLEGKITMRPKSREINPMHNRKQISAASAFIRIMRVRWAALLRRAARNRAARHEATARGAF